MATLRSQERAWTAWFIGVLFVILVFGFQSGYAITKGEVAGALHLSTREIGLVGSVYTWCFAVAQLMSGSLLDRVGARRVLPLAATALTLGIVGFATARSFGMLLASQVLVALGASFGFVGAGIIGGVWFGMARFGVMFAYVQFIASISAFFNQRVFHAALQRWSWQEVILTMALSGAGLVVVMLLLLKDPHGWDETHGWPRPPGQFVAHVLHDVNTVLRISRLWAVLVVGAVSFAGMLAVGIVWGPDIAMAQGLTKGQANAVAPFCWLGLALGAPLFATLSDRLGRRRPLLALSVCVQLVLLLVALLLTISSTVLMGALFFAFGLAAGGSMLPFTMAAELAGTSLAGTSAALVNGTQFVAGGLLMFLPGWLQDSLGLSMTGALLSVPVALAVGLLVAVALPETFGLSRAALRAQPA